MTKIVSSVASIWLSMLLSGTMTVLVWSGCGPSSDQGSSGAATTSPEVRMAVARGQTALEKRQFVRGLAAVDEALKSNAQVPDLHFVRGRLLFEMDQIENSRLAFERVIEIQPEYKGAWHNLGNAAFRQKNYREALKFYRNETQLHSDPMPWHGMGGTYWALGLADSSLLAYEQSIAIDSTYGPGYASLADWHESNGDFDKAITFAQKALEQSSGTVQLQSKLGALLVRGERYDEAVATLEPLVELEPWNHTIQFSLGQALQRLGRGGEGATYIENANRLREVQATLDRLRRTARGQPDNFQVQIEYADALRNGKRFPDALRQYQVASSLRPKNLALLNNIATLQLQLGDPEAAYAGFVAILDQDSTFSDAWLNMALHYARTGQEDESKRAFANALRYGPNNPRVQRLRSTIETAQ